MCAPVATNCGMTPVIVNASGIGSIGVLRFPIVADFDVLGAATILGTGLVGLIGVCSA